MKKNLNALQLLTTRRTWKLGYNLSNDNSNCQVKECYELLLINNNNNNNNNSKLLWANAFLEFIFF